MSYRVGHQSLEVESIWIYLSRAPEECIAVSGRPGVNAPLALKRGWSNLSPVLRLVHSRHRERLRKCISCFASRASDSFSVFLVHGSFSSSYGEVKEDAGPCGRYRR